jgi:hypothetical protein
VEVLPKSTTASVLHAGAVVFQQLLGPRLGESMHRWALGFLTAALTFAWTSPARSQGLTGTVHFANGRQLTGRIALGTATFIQGQGITDASRRTDTLYFSAGGGRILPIRLREFRSLRLSYEDAGHGLLRRVAHVALTDSAAVEGTLPAWHEAPAGPGRLEFTRYLEVECQPFGKWRKIEIPDRDDVPPGDRVIAVDFTSHAPRIN